MTQNYVGTVITGRYKRAGRAAVNVAIEVTAHVAMSDHYGKRIPYVFGTRMDAGSEGNIVLMRTDCFKADTLKSAAATAFKPIEGLDKGEWFVTPPGNGDSFAFVERVSDSIDQEWAIQLGGKPLSSYVV